MANQLSNSSRKGRNLELLVKRIKEHQLPEATICSPDYVLGKDTGQRSEVDVGIRLLRNDGTVYIAIECRNRDAVQAVEWVEQLICKKQSINANVLVAVTSLRFSKPARIKALKHGVILAQMSSKLAEEIAALASSFFITLCYLAPRITSVQPKIPTHLNDDLESYKYCHESIDRELTLIELAHMLTTPNLVRTIPRYVKDWSTAKFAKIGLTQINATVMVNGQPYPIQKVNIVYELNYGEIQLPLRAAQELSTLDPSELNATVFSFGASNEPQSEIIVDTESSNLRWDLICKSLQIEGKILIKAGLKASKPTSGYSR